MRILIRVRPNSNFLLVATFFVEVIMVGENQTTYSTIECNKVLIIIQLNRPSRDCIQYYEALFPNKVDDRFHESHSECSSHSGYSR